MAKVKGAGTLVWARKAPLCDLSIADATYANSAAAATALTAAGYKLIGCVFSATPPGYEYDTVEDEPCLGDGEGTPYSDTLEVQVGTTVQVGKACYKATGTNLDEDGNITEPYGAPPNASKWEVIDCGCAYPDVDVGTQQVNTLDHEVAFCPGDEQTDEFCNACGEQYQFVMQYPRVVVPNDAGDGFECRTCAHTYCGYVTSWTPQAVTPDEFMKADMTVTRSSDFRKFCWTDPVT